MPCECDSLFASQHSDDETLFSFYNILRYKPHVIVVLRSYAEARAGGPRFAEREAETWCAMKLAGVTWEQWEYPDTDPDWPVIARFIEEAAHGYEHVIAPAYEEGGHDHHNAVGMIVRRMRPASLIQYLTYVRGQGRSDFGIEVEPTVFEAEQKRIALACYPSQRTWPPTAPWFGDDQREHIL